MVSGSQVAATACGSAANFFIARWFGDCVYSTWEFAAFCLGLSSIFFWLIAQLPQFITNFLRQSADALSPWFLIQWLAGDSFNFLGCVLTGDQLATQTITAGYFIVADFIIIIQYVYYQIRNRNVIHGVYYSDSDESLHKPSVGYHEVANTGKNSALQKSLEESAFVNVLGANTSKSLVKNLTLKKCRHNPLDGCNSIAKDCAFCNGQNLVTMLAPGKGFEPGETVDPSIISEDMTSTQPFDSRTAVSNSRKTVHFCNNRVIPYNVSPSSNLARAEEKSARPVSQAPFLFSTLDLKYRNSWMYGHRHRLRRLVQEYGLEFGHERLSRIYQWNTARQKEKYLKQHVVSRMGPDDLPALSRKVRLKALLSVACLFGMAVSRWGVYPKHNYIMDHNFGSFLGRRALLALSDPSEEQTLKRLKDVSMSQHSAAFTGGQFLVPGYSTNSWTKLLGRSLGWVSSALYLGSRLSQLVKNKQRRSTEGLSLGMVACAVLANLTYGSSIVMRVSSWEYIIGKAPWIVGSLGTIVLDFSIVMQAYIYSWYSKKGIPSEYTPLLA